MHLALFLLLFMQVGMDYIYVMEGKRTKSCPLVITKYCGDAISGKSTAAKQALLPREATINPPLGISMVLG